MAVTEVFGVSEFGMDYQKLRVDVAARNIANANVIVAGDANLTTQTVTYNGDFENALFNPEHINVVNKELGTKSVFKPEHPMSDAEGFIHYANINVAEQMLVFTQATRAYEANIKAFNAQMSILNKALEIGK